MIAAARPVLGEEWRIEQPVGQGREAGVEPASHGHRQATLAAVDDFPGDESARCFL